MNEIQRLTDMHPDEEFLHSLSDWIQDIKIIDKEFGGVRGICLPESRRTCTFANRHEAWEDIVKTCVHENVHQCCSDEEVEQDSFMIDIEQEHVLIRNMQWMEKNFDENTYYSVIRGAHIKPRINEKNYHIIMKKMNKLSDKLEFCVNEEDE